MTIPAKNADLKLTNMRLLFECIQRNGSISRKQIQNLTGLSWGTISTMAAELLQKGILVETISPQNEVGRIPKNVEINQKKNLLIGIDVNITGLTFIVSDLGGKVITSQRTYLESNTRTYILETLQNEIEKLLNEYPACIAIGVSIQGLLDSSHGISLFNTFFEGWKNIRLKDILEEKFTLPVFLFHDPDCFTRYEQYKSKYITPDIKNAIILRLDDGIGMSLLLNGEIYTGSNNLAAEFAHTTIHPEGKLCPCGKRGCLETYCSAKGIVSSFVDASLTNHYDKYSFYDIVKKAKAKDGIAISVFERMGKYLGIALANLINIFDPEVILLSGYLTDYRTFFEKPLAKSLADIYQGNHYQTKLYYEPYKIVAPCLGAVFFTVDKLFSRIFIENESC